MQSPSPEELQEALRQGKSWSSVKDNAEGYLIANSEPLRLMAATKGLERCRMPLLYGPQCPGGDEFQASQLLTQVGEVLFWSTLRSLDEGDDEKACETALVHLRFGRDVKTTGSFLQATVGMHLYALASRSLAEALTQHALSPEALRILEEGLKGGGFPETFGEDSLNQNQMRYLRLAQYKHDPLHVRWVRAANLQGLIDVRSYNLSQYCLSYRNTYNPNALMSYPKSQAREFDSVEGLSSGVALLRIGVAVQQYEHDTGALPSSLNALVPRYLGRIPENPAGTPFTFESRDTHCEIVSDEIPHHASRRALRLEPQGLTERN